MCQGDSIVFMSSKNEPIKDIIHVRFDAFKTVVINNPDCCYIMKYWFKERRKESCLQKKSSSFSLM